ncbi:unnamed protein product [Closterium sp. NIES-64]|nr:unnamed protein product [Closterium sp. NIES-64]
MASLEVLAYTFGVLAVVLFGAGACAFAVYREMKQGGPDTPDFFLTARKSVPMLTIAWSFYAGAMGSWALFGPPSYCLYAGTLGMIMYAISAGLPIIIVAWFGAVIHRLVPSVVSMADYVRRRFGLVISLYVSALMLFNMGVAITADVISLYVSALMLFNMGVAITAEYTAVGSLFTDIIGSKSLPIILVIGLVSLTYTAIGGLYVSIITDQWQVGISVVFVLFIFVCNIADSTLFPGVGALHIHLQRCSPHALPLTILPSLLAPTTSPQHQAGISVVFVLVLFIFVCATFDAPLGPLPSEPVDLTWSNEYGLASIAVMPISLISSTLFSEAMWQRRQPSMFFVRQSRLPSVISLFSPLSVISLFSPPSVISLFSPPSVISLFSPPSVISLFSPPSVISLFSPPSVISLFSPPSVISLFSPPSVISLFSPPSVISLFSPPSIISLFSPPSVISLFSPPSIISLFSPPSVISLFSPPSVQAALHSHSIAMLLPLLPAPPSPNPPSPEHQVLGVSESPGAAGGSREFSPDHLLSLLVHICPSAPPSPARRTSCWASSSRKALLGGAALASVAVTIVVFLFGFGGMLSPSLLSPLLSPSLLSCSPLVLACCCLAHPLLSCTPIPFSNHQSSRLKAYWPCGAVWQPNGDGRSSTPHGPTWVGWVVDPCLPPLSLVPLLPSPRFPRSPHQPLYHTPAFPLQPHQQAYWRCGEACGSPARASPTPPPFPSLSSTTPHPCIPPPAPPPHTPGLLAVWGGVWQPNEDFTNTNTILFSLFNDTTWILVITTVLAVVMSESAVDSLQNAIADTLTTTFLAIIDFFLSVSSDAVQAAVAKTAFMSVFEAKGIWAVRAIVLLFNIPPLVVALKGYNVLQLFLLANLLTTTSVIPVMAGVIPGKWSRWVVTPFSVGFGCLSGIASLFIWTQIYSVINDMSYSDSLYQVFLFAYDYPPFLMALGFSFYGMLVGAGLEAVLRMALKLEYPEFDLGAEELPVVQGGEMVDAGMEKVGMSDVGAPIMSY